METPTLILLVINRLFTGGVYIKIRRNWLFSIYNCLIMIHFRL